MFTLLNAVERPPQEKAVAGIDTWIFY